ncbi:protein of unknown function DUF214 [Desulfovibrio sp. X2]|nr:protein of unknown function DUF214 [Desulfovibrio sp. X2]
MNSSSLPSPSGPMSLRIARRELRQGLSRFGVFVACLVLGVACIALVGSLAAGVEAGISRDARAILGGDVEVSQSFQVPPQAVRAMLEAAGKVSEVATMRVMTRAAAPGASAPSGGEAAPVLAELKAVDANWPLYGHAELAPAMPLAAALEKRDGTWGAVCEDALLARLGLAVGDFVQVGEAKLQIRAVLTREPDRAVSVFTLGPRLLVSLDALPATGLVLPGSLVRREYRVRLTPPQDAHAFVQKIEDRFADAPFRVRDYTSAGPRLKQFIDALHLYLTFVGLAAILVGGLGMGNAVASFLEDKRPSIAVMKCLGATPGLLFRAYLLQIMVLAAVGVLLGLALGAGLPWLLRGQLARLLPVPLAAGLYPRPLLTAAGFGLLTALAFSLRPLLAAGTVPAAGLFRGYLDGGALSRRGRAVTLLGAVGLAAYAVAVTPDRRMAFFFTLAAAAAFAVFKLAAMAIRRVSRLVRPENAPRLRLAASALHRPGNATDAVVFALGLGLTVLVAVNLAGGNFAQRIAATIPAHAPSYFFIDIQPSQAKAFDTLVRSLPGVHGLTRQPMLRARITRIAGKPVNPEAIPKDYRWTVNSDRGVTYMATPPENNPVVAGKWWPANYKGPPVISLTEDIARAFGVHVGDTLSMNLMGREITARIANLRRVEWASLAMNFAIIFPPGVLEHAPQTHIATVYADEDAEAGVLKAVSAAFPNVSAIRIKEVLTRVGGLMQDIATAGNAVAAVALAAGLLVLSATLRAAADRRIYEAVVLKVVGATRGDILASLAMENLFLGLAAGVVAGGLGTALGYAVVTRVMKQEWTFLPATVLLTVLGSVVLTLAVGLLGVRRVLGQKAAPILRNE